MAQYNAPKGSKMTAEDLHRYTQSFASSSGQTSAQMADSWRVKGNAQFKERDYGNALECYNQSIQCHPTVPALANRAMVHLKLGMYEECIDDSSRALELDSNHVKSYLRRATARHRLERWVEAVEDFEEAIRRETSNTEAIEGRRACIAEYVEKTGTRFESVQVPITFEDMDVGETNDEMIRPIQVQQYSENKTAAPPAGQLATSGTDSQQVTGRTANAENANAAIDMIRSAQKIPKSSIEFEKSWRSCKGDSVKQAWVLEHVSKEAMPVLLKQCLSPKLLHQVLLAVLSRVLKSNWDQGIGILRSIPSTDRFSMNCMSLTKAQKREITDSWKTAFQDLMEHMPDDYDKIQQQYRTVLLENP